MAQLFLGLGRVSLKCGPLNALNVKINDYDEMTKVTLQSNRREDGSFSGG